MLEVRYGTHATNFIREPPLFHVAHFLCGKCSHGNTYMSTGMDAQEHKWVESEMTR